MWGIGMYLMRLADYLTSKKRIRGSKKCDICDADYDTIEDMEVHRREINPDASPRITDS